jgi:hypothetical protein
MYASPTSVSASTSVDSLQRLNRILSPPTANLYLRLFADAAYFAKVGSKITTWQGTGSSGKAASQGTGSLQPVPGTSINGKTTVEFSGGQLLTVSGVPLGVFDIYIVCRVVLDAVERIIIEHSANGYALGNGHFLATRQSGATITRGAIPTNRVPAGPNYLATGSANLFRHAFNGTHASHLLEKDGSNFSAQLTFAGNPGTSVVTDSLYIGARTPGSYFLIGSIGEILIYNAAPDATRAAQILAYSKQYWGTP